MENKPDSLGMVVLMNGTIGEGAMKGRNGWGEVSGDDISGNNSSDEPFKQKQSKSSHSYRLKYYLKRNLICKL